MAAGPAGWTTTWNRRSQTRNLWGDLQAEKSIGSAPILYVKAPINAVAPITTRAIPTRRVPLSDAPPGSWKGPLPSLNLA
jgi:hypothetical protein